MPVYVAAVLITALAAGSAWGNIIEEGGPYYLTQYDVTYAEVFEKVYDLEQSEELTGIPGVYLYTYTVVNDMYTMADDYGLWCWGFLDRPPGAVRVSSPDGWGFLDDCSFVVGGPTFGWYTDPDPEVGAPLPKDTEIDGFWIVSPGAPYALYDAYSHGSISNTSFGKISGPTPEPCTLALVGFGFAGAGIIRLFKRSRE